jgi:dihydropteroate synthase-like protein
MTDVILETLSLSKIDLVLLPGFIQWNTTNLEEKYSVDIRKGPEFASDLPNVLKNLDVTTLSNTIAANRLFENSGELLYNQIINEYYETARDNLGTHTYFINENRSDLMIGRDLPPPIIAEVVNCTVKNDKSILKKAKHYIESGADIIDIGCISNKPNPDKIKNVIKLLRNNFDTLISIDSMEPSEILAAADEGVDMILSLDIGNYEDCLSIPKDIPIVILPTNIKEGYFPKDPKTRVENLFTLSKKLQDYGFTRLIADPLLETPIVPGIVNSLQTYALYKKLIIQEGNNSFELPLFFGVSNVVELMDIDSVGINGLLASIAIELGIGILFTVEHSTKLMGGVRELKESVKLNYIAKHKRTPPINQGLSIFKAKGKTSQNMPQINKQGAINVDYLNLQYDPDEKGYFKIYVNHYSKQIYILHFSNAHTILNTMIGTDAESLSKKIIELNLTDHIQHVNYLGRELVKAEICLQTGKPYIQD